MEYNGIPRNEEKKHVWLNPETEGLLTETLNTHFLKVVVIYQPGLIISNRAVSDIPGAEQDSTYN